MVLKTAEISLVTVLHLVIEVIMTLMSTLYGTVRGRMGGIILLLQHMVLHFLLENAEHLVHMLLLRLVLPRDVIGEVMQPRIRKGIVATGVPPKKRPIRNQELGKADRHPLLLLKEIAMTILPEAQTG